MNFDASILRAGDVLLYAPEKFFHDPLGSLVGDAIVIATKKMKSHVEVATAKTGRVFAARLDGVGYYDVRVDECLASVRRHDKSDQFNDVAAQIGVQGLVGQPYETTSLFSFFNPWRKSKDVARVCSPVAVLYLRGGGCEPINPDCHESNVTPGDLWVTGGLKTIWRNASLDRMIRELRKK